MPEGVWGGDWWVGWLEWAFGCCGRELEGAEEGRELRMGMVGGEHVVCYGRELLVAPEERGRLAGCYQVSTLFESAFNLLSIFAESCVSGIPTVDVEGDLLSSSLSLTPLCISQWMLTLWEYLLVGFECFPLSRRYGRMGCLSNCSHERLSCGFTEFLRRWEA
jgi:hypothetical protein